MIDQSAPTRQASLKKTLTPLPEPLRSFTYLLPCLTLMVCHDLVSAYPSEGMPAQGSFYTSKTATRKTLIILDSQSPPSMQKSFHIITFGCQMNVNDSAWLSRSLVMRGFTQVPLEEADIVILNTCSVRDKPEQKVYSAIGRVRQVTKGRNIFVAVAGCVAQQIGEGFFERFPQVRLIVGSDGLIDAPEAIERLYAEPHKRLVLTAFLQHYPERPVALTKGNAPASAYVNIMQGCNNFCAYCIVPFTRGRQKSRSADAIIAECQELLDNGTREITLLGQNVNSFGLDAHGDGTSFETLLFRVAALSGLERVRFVTPHPKDISDRVIQAFGELPNLCPRLHLPLQSGSDRILQAMGRKYDAARFMDIVSRLRQARPDIALSTDIIVGFPGETEEDFAATCHIAEEANFISSFSFCYSDRPGTRASLLSDKITPALQQERLLRFQSLQDRLGMAWLKSRENGETSVLLETHSPKSNHDMPGESWQGRDPYGAAVHVPLPVHKGHCGRFVPVRIREAKKHSLLADPIGEPC